MSKRFAGTTALGGVSLSVRAGEVHALLGGNGSGKSTLIKILAGVHRADRGGSIAVGALQIDADQTSPAWARAVGLRFVHQDLGLFETLSTAENFFAASTYPRRTGRIDWPAARREAAAALARLGVDVDVRSPMSTLGPADRTLIAIARALKNDEAESSVLILDEPTAALAVGDVERVVGAVRRLTARGHAVVFVSHRLHETIRLADSATILRDGRVAARRRGSDVAEDVLTVDIAGRERRRTSPRREHRRRRGEPLLEADGVASGPIRDATFTLRRGEIVALGGLVGSGRSWLLEMLFGRRRREAGKVVLDGMPYSPQSPREAMEAGVSFVSEHRARDNVFSDLGLIENLSAADHRRYARFAWFDRAVERADALRDVERLRIRAQSLMTPLAHLSGGNQQKAIIGRWLRRGARVLLLDEPTQGVDVVAREEIHELVRAAVQRGAGAVVVSSDFHELAQLADRVLVLEGGRIVTEHSEAITADSITRHVFRTPVEAR